jgi:uncharacterized protein YbjT (DUF2867 family)
MKLVVFGANGQTGRLPTSHALAAGHRVVAVSPTRRHGMNQRKDYP